MKKKLLFLVLALALTIASFPPSTIASTCTNNCVGAFQNRNNACSFLEFDERTACMQNSWEMYQGCLADCQDAGMG
jgi:hypothetical protein